MDVVPKSSNATFALGLGLLFAVLTLASLYWGHKTLKDIVPWWALVVWLIAVLFFFFMFYGSLLLRYVFSKPKDKSTFGEADKGKIKITVTNKKAFARAIKNEQE